MRRQIFLSVEYFTVSLSQASLCLAAALQQSDSSNETKTIEIEGEAMKDKQQLKYAVNKRNSRYFS